MQKAKQDHTAELLHNANAYYIAKNMQQGDVSAAEWLIAHRNVKSNAAGKIYVYDNEAGHYRAEGETLLKADIIREFGAIANRSRVGEIIAKVQALSYTDEEILNRTIPPHLLPVKNGVYDMSTGALLSHSNEYFFTYKHPITYDPNATCPLLHKFLGEIVANGHDKEILLDIAALCLYRDRITRHFFVLCGGGHNGKSLWLTVLKTFIGKGRVVSITPQALAEDTFAPSQLCDKHANLGADIPGGVIHDTAIVKTATGGDTISVQRKGVDREEREVYAEFVWASNDPPRIVEDTHAIWDRLVVVEFPYTFVANPAKDQERQAIPNLEAQLITPGELSGLLNECLRRLPLLIQRRDLSVPHNPQETRRKYRTLSDTPAVFVDEECEEIDYDPSDGYNKSSGYTTCEAAYKAYKAWCRKNGVIPVSSNRFGRSVEKLGFERGRDESQRSYRGLRLKTACTDCTDSSYSSLYSPSPTGKNKAKSVQTVTTVFDSVEKTLRTASEVLEFLRAKNTPTPYDDILRLVDSDTEKPDEWLTRRLTAMSQSGHIFSPKPGYWMVLQ